MKKIALISTLAALASAQSNLLEIYKNKSFIHQSFVDQKSEFSLNLPEFVALEDIDVSASCELISLNLNEPKPLEDERYDKFKKAQNEFEELGNKVGALNAKNKFLNNFSAFKEQSVENLSADADKFYDITLKALAEASQAKKLLNDANLKMQELEREVVNFQKLDLKFECDPKQVKISYPVGVSVNLKNKI